MAMRTPSRRALIGWAAGLTAATGLVVLAKQAEPPTEAWVRERLWGDKLLAYAVWDGVPRAVVHFSPGRVSYDLMIPGDWFWPNWPPAPQWQLMGLGYAIAASNAPATVGYAPCVGIVGERCEQTPDLFGQINDPGIVAMEVLLGDGWRRFAVAAPAFAVRLDGATGPPAGYRWLDADERVIWESESSSPTSPGARTRRRRRTRRRATLDPPASEPAGTPAGDFAPAAS